jgi:peptidoglycan/LPS O-acetylase OafA/YrhL
MTPGLSLYLDLLRVMAAVQVVVYHLGKIDAAGVGQGLLNAWGHEAVVIFFVLSGFVISHAANTSDRTFARYASSRISRLYSVVLPVPVADGCIRQHWLAAGAGSLCADLQQYRCAACPFG